jgi:hypothetical protein
LGNIAICIPNPAMDHMQPTQMRMTGSNAVVVYAQRSAKDVSTGVKSSEQPARIRVVRNFAKLVFVHAMMVIKITGK